MVPNVEVVFTSNQSPCTWQQLSCGTQESEATPNPASLTRVIGKHRNALLHFFGGKSTQAQSCQGFSLLQIEEIGFIESNARIEPIPLYTLSAASLARAIRKHRMVMPHFLRGKSTEAQACKGFEMSQIESIAVEGGACPIPPLGT